jgi:hypothetical protein
MPELSRFLGIIIAMYYRDHGPAHFHAIYGDFEITVEIESAREWRFSEASANSCDRVAGTAPHRIARGLVPGAFQPSSF